MAPGKHLVNVIDHAVQESLSGHVLTYPRLTLHVGKRVVLAPDWKKETNKVAVICGGGSGHEPFASGFVGLGMLTASVAGSIYAAPPSNSILHAIKCVTTSSKGGCFVIIPNYTGDRLNFGIAIEKAKSSNIEIGQVVVGEDCSIPPEEQGRAGKRGLCGLVFMIKIVGALAERGKKLDDISEYAQLVVKNMATYGVGLKACSIPGRGLMFDLPPDEIEFGLGVHGEAGYKRMKLQSANEVVKQMLKEITKNLNLKPGCSVAILVNNFGALSQLEQGIVTREAIVQLGNNGMKVKRAYSSLLMTSLDGSGFHITVLNLPEDKIDLLLSCLDDKTEAPRWPGCVYSVPVEECCSLDTEEPSFEDDANFDAKNMYQLNTWQETVLKEGIINASKALIAKEDEINELDTGCGDGDCGSTLRRLAEGILSSVNSLSFQYPYKLFSELSRLAEECMGGTSGALYSLMFATAATVFDGKIDGLEIKEIWARTFRTGINGVMKYGKAQIGDKTMLDVLDPACRALEKNVQKTYLDIVKNIVNAAKKGCEQTKNMKPKSGRASYVKQEQYLTKIDAGAFGAFTWIQAIAETIINKK